MNKKSIVYYSANHESPEFEHKIIEEINKVKGDLDVISVTQKPVDFGHNICVGDVGYSYLNAFRQCLIGIEAATTPFVVITESDCLYPPGYFDYDPPDSEHIYIYENLWILFNQRGINTFRRKQQQPRKQVHGSVIYPRDMAIDILRNDILRGLPIWSDKQIKIPNYTDRCKFIDIIEKDPIISIITGANGRRNTTLTGEKKDKFDYWGTVADVKRRMLI